MRKLDSEARGMRLPSRSSNCATVGSACCVDLEEFEDTAIFEDIDALTIFRKGKSKPWARYRLLLEVDSMQTDETSNGKCWQRIPVPSVEAATKKRRESR